MVQPLIKAIILHSLSRICLAHCLVPEETDSDEAVYWCLQTVMRLLTSVCMLISLWSLACDWLAGYENFLKIQILFEDNKYVQRSNAKIAQGMTMHYEGSRSSLVFHTDSLTETASSGTTCE